MHFETRVLQQLIGFTGDMFQSASARVASTASFVKPAFCISWVTCFNQHLPWLALLPDFKHQVVLRVTCFNHFLLICPQLHAFFCNNLMVLRVMCFNQHLPLLALLPDFQNQVVVRVTCFNHFPLLCPKLHAF
jgi:hypothetical protein